MKKLIFLCVSLLLFAGCEEQDQSPLDVFDVGVESLAPSTTFSALKNTIGYYTDQYTFDVGGENKVQGFVSFSQGFVAPDFGTVILDTAGVVSGVIQQNPDTIGSLELRSDLNLDSGILFSPGARINGMGNSIIMHGDCSVADNGTLRITGDTIINGHGNTFNLGSQARIVVDHGVTLTLRNMRVKNTQNDLSNPIITANGSQARIALQDVELALEDEFVFADGKLFIHDDVVVSGQNAVFTYRSDQQSYIADGGLLAFDYGTKLLYYPTAFNRDLIALQSQTSGISFDQSDFEAMQTPLRLTKGTLSFDNNVTISSQVSSGFISQYDQERYNILIERTQQEVNTFAAMFDLDVLSVDIGADVNTVAWNSDGKYLAVGLGKSANKEIRIYEFDGTSLTDLDLLFTDTHATVYSLAWSSDDQYLAVGLERGAHKEVQVYLFDKTLPSLKALPGLSADIGADVYSVAWGRDDEYVAVGLQTGSGKEVRIYSFDGSSLTDLDALDTAVDASAYSVSWLDWSVFGTFLAVGFASGAHKEIRLYEFDGSSLSYQNILPADINAHVFSASWRSESVTSFATPYFAVALDGGAYKEFRVYWLNLANIVYGGQSLTGPTLKDLERTGVEVGARVYDVAWSPNGNYIAIGLDGSARKELRLYEFDESNLIDQGALDDDIGTQINAVDWNPDGNHVAVGLDSGATKELRVYTWSDKTASAKVLAWTSDGNYLAVGLSGGKTNEIQEVKIYSFDGLSLTDLGVLPIEIGAGVNALAWSSDDKYLAVGFDSAANKEIRIYEFNVTSRAATLTDIDALSSDIGASVYTLCWSPGDKHLAVGLDYGAYREIRVYYFKETESRLIYFPFSSVDVNQSVYSISWSDDGNYLVVGLDAGAKKEVRVYNVTTDGLVVVGMNDLDALPSATGYAVNSVTWSPDGNYVAVGLVGGANEEVRIYSFDGSDLTPVNGLTADVGVTVRSVSWRSTGNYIAVGFNNHNGQEVRVYQLVGGTTLNFITGVNIQSEGWGWIGWPFNTWIYPPEDKAVLSVAWSPNGSYLAVGAVGEAFFGELRVYSFSTLGGGSLSLRDDVDLGGILDRSGYAVTWKPGGNNYIAVAAQGGFGFDELRVYYFSGYSLSLRDSVDLGDWFSDYNGYSVAWNSDGKHIAVGAAAGLNKQVRVYKYEWGNLSRVAQIPENLGSSVKAVAWSPDGKSLAVGSSGSDDKVRIYTFSGTQLFQMESASVGYNVSSVAWRNDGKHLVAGVSQTGAKEVIVYKFDTTDYLVMTDLNALSLDLSSTVRSVAWTSDHKYLAVGLESTADKEVHVYSFNGTSLTDLNALASDIGETAWAVAWSPNEKYLAVGLGEDAHKEVRIFWFNNNSLFDLGALPVDVGATAYSVSWSPDGKYVSVGFAGGKTHKEIHVYELLQTTASWDQYAMVFGDSSYADPDYDVSVNVLGRAHIDLSGRIHDDSST